MIMPISFMIGALIPTGVLTFLFLWLSKKLIASRLVGWLVANVLSLIIAIVVGAFNLADGGAPEFAEAFFGYIVPQIVWLGVTGFIVRGQVAKQAKS